jgi:prophage regulatory protein
MSTNGNSAVPRFMRVEEVAAVTGLSRATIYKYVAERTFGFPRQVRLGPNRAAWVRSEIEGWIEERKAAREPVAEAA